MTKKQEDVLDADMIKGVIEKMREPGMTVQPKDGKYTVTGISSKVTGYRIVDGKLVRVVPFRAGIKKRNADRIAKQWGKKNPRRSGG